MLSLVTGLLLAVPAHAAHDPFGLIARARAIEARLTTAEISPSVAFELNAELADVQEKLGRAPAAPAMLTLTDAPAYDFGGVNLGQIAEHTFTLTNVGGTRATKLTGAAITAPFVFRGGYPGDDGTCSGDLGPGGSCTLKMVFQPTEPGFANDMLTLSYFDGQAEMSITRAVSGVGNAPPPPAR